MKECPICHTQYDDSLNFCTKDGLQLKSVDTSHVETQKHENIQGNQQREKKGCLKKLIIGGVIVVIALITIYNYLANAATYLRTEPSEIRASKAGGTSRVDIDYDGYIWTVNHQPEWVNIDENDNDFLLSIGPNQTGQLREGSITIQSGKLLSQVVVKQNAYATMIKASETSIKFSKGGANRDINIETDGCSWDAESTNWMTVTKDGEERLHIICPRNNGEYRTGTIKVKEDNAHVIIKVTQSGECNNCHGNGEITCNYCMGMGGMGFGLFYSSCIWCGGKGKLACGFCKGTGFRE